jgi:uncharacterized protein YabE (DUF348 family)
MVAHELATRIHDEMAVRGLGSKPITVIMNGEVRQITAVTWCEECKEFHLLLGAKLRG